MERVVRRPPSPALEPLIGRLRIEGGNVVHDGGPIIPRIAHCMDMLSMCYYGKWDIVEQDIATLREVYHGGRVLFTLGFGDNQKRGLRDRISAEHAAFIVAGGLSRDSIVDARRRIEIMLRSSSDYWYGRNFHYDMDPARYDRAVTWLEETCRRYGFRISFDGGDQFASGQNTDRFADYMRERLDPNVYVTVSAANEGWQTGLGDDNRKAARWLERVQTNILKVLTSPAEDDVDSMRYWSISPADMRSSHAAFGDDVGCARRMFNAGYEGIDNGLLPITFFDEPRGCSRNVSVHRVCNPKHLQGMCAAGLIGHGFPAWMGNVIRDGTSHGNVDGGEAYQDLAGFREWSGMIGYFEQHARDIFSWPIVCHGGTRWAGTQWFRVTGEGGRSEQTISADGRAFALNHSGPTEQVRGVVEDVIDLDEFTLYRGRV